MKHIHEISLFVASVFIGILILSSIILFNQIIVYRYFEFTCGTLWRIITTGIYVSLILGIVLTGFITARLFAGTVQSRRNLMIVGGSVGVVVVSLFSHITSSPYGQIRFVAPSAWILTTINQIFRLRPDAITVIMIMTVILIMMLLMIGVIACFGIAGAALASYLIRSPPDTEPKSTDRFRKGFGFKKGLSVLVIVIFACMVLPSAASVILIMSGVSDGTCMTDLVILQDLHSVDANRINDTSLSLIVIANFSGRESTKWTAQLYPSRMPMQIRLDGKDLSTQSVIHRQGLQDVITPAEGISRYGNGTSVTISGPDVYRNGSTGQHLVVTSYYDADFPTVIADTYV